MSMSGLVPAHRTHYTVTAPADPCVDSCTFTGPAPRLCNDGNRRVAWL